jgi:hypothetical protein
MSEMVNVTTINNNDILHNLALLKSKALRAKVWHKALSIHERTLTSLALRYIKHVRNEQLAIVLARIVIKLRLAVDSMARALSNGYAKACAWIKTMIGMGWSMYAHVSNNMVEWFACMYESSNG